MSDRTTEPGGAGGDAGTRTRDGTRPAAHRGDEVRAERAPPGQGRERGGDAPAPQSVRRVAAGSNTSPSVSEHHRSGKPTPHDHSRGTGHPREADGASPPGTGRGGARMAEAEPEKAKGRRAASAHGVRGEGKAGTQAGAALGTKTGPERAGGRRNGEKAVLSGHKSRSGKRRRRRQPLAAPQMDEPPSAAVSDALASGQDVKDGAGPPRSAEGRNHAVALPEGTDGRPGSGQAPKHPPRQPPKHRARPYRPMRARDGDAHSYAALDLGTNNCRLLIATPTRRGQFRVVDAFSRIVRLGQGLGRTNALDPLAMDRAVVALRMCAAKLEGRPIRRRRLIATEACRRAENGAEFIARVRAETGLSLEIVDRSTEAHLAVAGCSSLIDRTARGCVLFDIGGGSTEIALLDLASPERNPARSVTAWTSLPVGVVTLSERFGGQRVTRDLFEEMVGDVGAMIGEFADRGRLRRVVGTRRFHLLGTSGTVTTLAGLHLALPRYDRRKVDGLWMRREEVDAVQDALLDSTFEERRASPVIGGDRADLVLAGCAILEAIRREWPAQRLRVADRGLREGMLSDMMVSDDAWNRGGGRRAQ